MNRLKLRQDLHTKIDQKTKPLGSLGRIEELAIKVGMIQETLTPAIIRPTLLIFAGDHGVVAEGVSAYPQEVTGQMIANFLEEGAAANVFAKSVGCDWFVVDAGFKGDLPDHPRLLKRKIARGTQNFRFGPAMSRQECEKSLQAGRDLVADLTDQGINTFVFGEMGIGNSSSAALLAHGFANVPLEVAVGPGTGVVGNNLDRKRKVLRESWEGRGASLEGLDILASFGGFEIAMMCGAFLEASQRRSVSLVDGYIASAAALASWKIDPTSLESMIFSHCSKEPGHRALLSFLEQRPILDLELCLGEGTGALLCLPLIRAATDMLNHMATMNGAGVSPKIN